MLAPHWSLAEMARHAVDFWLTTEDLPAAGEPRDASTATATSTSPTRRPTTRRPKRLYHKLKQMLNHLGMARHHVLRKNFYMDMTISTSPASPTRRAPAGSAPIRRPRCSTPTARPTSWTTCMSSTRASSPASVR